MTVSSVTLYLPQGMMQRARQAAETLQRPLEEVLITALDAMLPHIEDAPPDMQIELLRMTWLNDQELWAIARGALTDDQQRELEHLSEIQAAHPLSPEESTRLEGLRRAYGRVTLRKARAYALLSLRGGRPLLADMPSV